MRSETCTYYMGHENVCIFYGVHSRDVCVSHLLAVILGCVCTALLHLWPMERQAPTHGFSITPTPPYVRCFLCQTKYCSVSVRYRVYFVSLQFDLGFTFVTTRQYICNILLYWTILWWDTFKCIFLHENVRISIKISLKFVAKDPINNIPALVQIMASGWPGAKPLSQTMEVSLLMHI